MKYRSKRHACTATLRLTTPAGYVILNSNYHAEILFFAHRGVSLMKRIAALILSLVLLILTGCNMPSINLTGYDTYPEDDLQAFIDCLNNEQYDASSVYLKNYSTLGFFGFPAGTAHASMLISLNASRSFEVLGSSSIHGRNAAMSIEYTTLDFRKVKTDLSTLALEAIDNVQFETGQVPSDEEIDVIVTQVLETMLADPAPYYTTEEFRLSFQYEDNVWKLTCTNEFYSALIGYIV